MKAKNMRGKRRWFYLLGFVAFALIGGVIYSPFTYEWSEGTKEAIQITGELAETASKAVTTNAETNPRFWRLLFASGLILSIWTAVNFFSSTGASRIQRLKSSSPPAWAFATLLGAITLHWLFWSVKPDLWNEWRQSTTFWPMNLAAILAMFFIYQRGKAVRFVGWVLGGMIVVIAITSYEPPPGSEKPKNVSIVHPAPMKIGRLPAETVLSIIAECESNGEQFEDDGVTPLKNREGSSAIGKYQIMESIHGERARKHGFSLETEEGNEGYAYLLYGESGTRSWEKDSRSLACWGPKLLAISGFTPALFSTTWTITTNNQDWSMVYIPLGTNLNWERTEVAAYEIQTQTGKIYQFPRVLGDHVKIPGKVSSLKFRVVDEGVDSLTIRLKFKAI